MAVIAVDTVLLNALRDDCVLHRAHGMRPSQRHPLAGLAPQLFWNGRQHSRRPSLHRVVAPLQDQSPYKRSWQSPIDAVIVSRMKGAGWQHSHQIQTCHLQGEEKKCSFPGCRRSMKCEQQFSRMTSYDARGHVRRDTGNFWELTLSCHCQSSLTQALTRERGSFNSCW